MVLSFRSGKHPHEVALLSAATLFGVCGLFFFPFVATTTARALPVPFGHLLYAGLFIGSAISLVGVFWRGLTGALIERSGLFSVSVWGFSYGIAILINSGARGIGFGLFMASFAIANIVRVWQINHEIDQVEAARIVLGTKEE
jgi:hypothetical protein